MTASPVLPSSTRAPGPQRRDPIAQQVDARQTAPAARQPAVRTSSGTSAVSAMDSTTVSAWWRSLSFALLHDRDPVTHDVADPHRPGQPTAGRRSSTTLSTTSCAPAPAATPPAHRNARLGLRAAVRQPTPIVLDPEPYPVRAVRAARSPARTRSGTTADECAFRSARAPSSRVAALSEHQQITVLSLHDPMQRARHRLVGQHLQPARSVPTRHGSRSAPLWPPGADSTSSLRLRGHHERVGVHRDQQRRRARRLRDRLIRARRRRVPQRSRRLPRPTAGRPRVCARWRVGHVVRWASDGLIRKVLLTDCKPVFNPAARPVHRGNPVTGHFGNPESPLTRRPRPHQRGLPRIPLPGRAELGLSRQPHTEVTDA